MYFYLSKTLQELLWPMSWSLIAFVTAMVLWRRKRERGAVRAFLVGLGILVVFSLPLVAGWIAAPLEGRYPVKKLVEYPTADVIVVLGGSVAGRVPPRLESEELGGNRCGAAARLYQMKKAPWILVSDGVPYRASDGTIRTGSDDMTEVLETLGVPATAVLKEARSRTTRENAHFTKQILDEKGFKTVLLVTVAGHMQRAADHFRRAGIDVIPVPTSHSATRGPLTIKDFVPSAFALAGSQTALKEWFGYWVGR